ncbi:SNF2-related protein [Paraglaciecola sp. 2405UD69-4]|uniref:DEAD/DEAH box helicase n=1 Tax=Paraglaciecola sp. 2405UD69-4 TaxID=3391836 RepID=UPI0039C9C55E
MLSLSVVKEHFATRDWNKGKRLAEFGYVNKDSIKVTDVSVSGTVRSESSSDTFEVVIEVENDEVDAYCTCPVRYFCKHAAALTSLSLDDSSNFGAASNTLVEEWLTALQTTSIEAEPYSSEVYVYILESTEFDKKHGVTLSICRSRALKSGDLSKSMRNVYLSDHDLKDKNLSNNERHILADLIGAKNARGCYQDFSLIKRVIETGRCYWKNMNSAPLTLGTDCRASFNWQEKRKGSFSLNYELENDSVEVLYTNPPSYLDTKQHTIGYIDFAMDPSRAVSMLKMPVVNQQQLSWVLPQLKTFMQDEFDVIGAPSIEVDKDLFTPTPKLHLFSPQYTPDGSMAKLVFAYNEVDVNPHSEDTVIETDADPLTRNIWFEKQAIEILHQAGFKSLPDYSPSGFQPNEYILRLNKNDWPRVLHQVIPGLSAQGWQVSTANGFYYSTSDVGSIDAEIEEQDNNFFSLQIDIQINGKPRALFPILQSAISQLSKEELLSTTANEDQFVYISMGKGHSLPLQLSVIKPLLNQFVELFLPNALDKQGKLTLSRLQSPQTLDVLDGQGIVSRGEKALREVANKLKNFDGIKPVKCPEDINATLRDYQQTGLNWLQFLREYQLSGILADDMGLGKTLQAIANLTIELNAGRLSSPALIIAPTSVVFNWQSEIEKFSPGLNHVVMHGDKRQSNFENMHQQHVIITSYALIVRDIEYYEKLAFHYLILDEAQYIKNPKTKLYSALLSLNAKHKLCMTGTPMENHLGELWSQFNFLLPSFLSSQTQFTKLFRTPIEKQKSVERQQVLNQRIQPFILRRTKDKIAKELPQKTEIISSIRLEGKQAELYENVRLTMDSKLKAIIETKGLMRSQIEILDAMLKLRQVCCHPQLLSLSTAQKVKESAKLAYLMDMLPELVAEGRRILVFSQFTSMLQLIEPELKKQDIGYVKLTGATKDRQKVINAFKNGQVPVFLISLKAGGTGLNLTEADVVIHYDPWWNPAVESQATDRAHRIGQDKPVFVYKLVIEGSIEQKILELQSNKSALANAVLSDQLSEKSVGLDSNTLQSLLKPLGD